MYAQAPYTHIVYICCLRRHGTPTHVYMILFRGTHAKMFHQMSIRAPYKSTVFIEANDMR